MLEDGAELLLLLLIRVLEVLRPQSEKRGSLRPPLLFEACGGVSGRSRMSEEAYDEIEDEKEDDKENDDIGLYCDGADREGTRAVSAVAPCAEDE